MTNEERIRRTLELLRKQKPDEDSIDRMHAKTDGELEHLVPSDPASIAVHTPDGEVGLDELYKKQQADKQKEHEENVGNRMKSDDGERRFKRLLRRRW